MILCFKKDLSIEINGSECITKAEVKEEKIGDKFRIIYDKGSYIEERVMGNY